VAEGQPDPAYVAYLEEGNDIGGIDSGFLLKSSRLMVVDVVQVNKIETYINPNTGLPELLNDRPPLVVRAQVPVPGGAPFPITVIVNHLRSLNGVDDVVDGRVRAKRAQCCSGMECPRPHLHVIGLEDDAALFAPIVVERQDQVLEA
jgi:predicted extracellular nuclease